LAFKGLRVRLLLLVLVVLGPAVAIVLVAVDAQRRLLVEQARGEAARLAELVAETNQRSIDGARGLLLGLSRLHRIARHDPACSAALAPVLAQDRAYLNIGAALPDGRIFCSAAPPLGPGPVDVSDRRWFKDAVASRGDGVGEYVVSHVVHAGAFGMARAVLDGEGRLVAVVFASLDLRELQRRLDEVEVADGAEVAILDQRGTVLAARGRPGLIGTRYDARLPARLAEAGAPLDVDEPGGARRTYALSDVREPDGDLVVRVVAGLPTAAVLAPVDRIVGRTLAGLAVVALLSLAVAGFMGEFLLVRRLRALGTAARRIAAGDLSARSGLDPGGEEVGQLIRAFDDMAGSLERGAVERAGLEEQLRQAQKMEAVGQLAGGVAHDFNNLLTAVLSCARLIEQDLPAGHPSRADAAEIVASGERAATLTRQLLAFSRRQRLAPRPIELAGVARELEPMLRRLLAETVTLEVRTPVRGPVEADPSQVAQVIVNLVVNARDAMPAGGRVAVTVSELDGPARAACAEPGLPAGPLSVLSVADDGVGMDEATRARIFEPFFTTKAPGKGTGLGLSTVYGIVAQSGGAIRVRSAPGQGSELAVYLPRHAGVGPSAPPPAPPRAAGGRETVLLVEDDAVVRRLARRALEGAGYAVRDAPGPRAAAAVAEELRGRLDLLVTDVMLPEESGPALARRLGEGRPELRVLFMSGYAGDAAGGLADAPFLQKPFTPDVLLAKVREVLDGGR
jgi:signal transduction histidine kinase